MSVNDATHAERNRRYRQHLKEMGIKDVSRIERVRKHRKQKKEKGYKLIGTFDFETDPFDESDEGQEPVYPFLVCLDTEDEKWHLWREVGETLMQFLAKFVEKLKSLEKKYILYAHNGGRFDIRFLLNFLRGKVDFKGARVIMKADIGNVQLRDSLHIFPQGLATYKKDKIDYQYMRAEYREQYRDRIIEYCYRDCADAKQLIQAFWREHGNKISIGQAAFSKLRKDCKADNISIDMLSEHMDGLIRGIDTNYYHRETYGKQWKEGFFKGGRCECLGGRGKFVSDSVSGTWKIYDVNSMYPYVMVYYRHPIGNNFTQHSGPVNNNTAFIRLHCKSDGAFLKYNNTSLSGETAEGEFCITIHEYKVATELKLIRDVRIIECIDCDKWASFGSFILPLYNKRQEVKQTIEQWRTEGKAETGEEWDRLQLEDLFLKLLMNNAYGKFAQNPRRFREQVFMDIDQEIDFPYDVVEEFTGEMPFKIVHKQLQGHWNDTEKCYPLREGKDRLRFYNVATGASITGAARSYLLFALYHAIEPIYCDTDSIICRSLRHPCRIDQTELGAWKCEKELQYIIINGKKLYGYAETGGKEKVKSKGMPGLSLIDMESILKGKSIRKKNKGVTISNDGAQVYIIREIQSTATKGLSLYRRMQDVRIARDSRTNAIAA